MSFLLPLLCNLGGMFMPIIHFHGIDTQGIGIHASTEVVWQEFAWLKLEDNSNGHVCFWDIP